MDGLFISPYTHRQHESPRHLAPKSVLACHDHLMQAPQNGQVQKHVRVTLWSALA